MEILKTAKGEDEHFVLASFLAQCHSANQGMVSHITKLTKGYKAKHSPFTLNEELVRNNLVLRNYDLRDMQPLTDFVASVIDI